MCSTLLTLRTSAAFSCLCCLFSGVLGKRVLGEFSSLLATRGALLGVRLTSTSITLDMFRCVCGRGSKNWRACFFSRVYLCARVHSPERTHAAQVALLYRHFSRLCKRSETKHSDIQPSQNKFMYCVIVRDHFNHSLPCCSFHS